MPSKPVFVGGGSAAPNFLVGFRNHFFMTFSIITPSYNQIDWLRLCVASVRDQVEVENAAATDRAERERPGF